jgi:hypothetical protein
MLSNFFRYKAVENFVEKLQMASGLLRVVNSYPLPGILPAL